MTHRSAMIISVSCSDYSSKMLVMMSIFLVTGLLGSPEVSPGEDEHPVRLVGGDSETEGRVEILFNGQWGSVCSTGWDAADASVVCRQLGLYGQGTGHVLMENVACHGNESRLSDCAFPAWGSTCKNQHVASVSCQIAEDFPIRLAGGRTEQEGLLEVLFRGQWHVLFISRWTASASSVVCWELGLPGPNMSYTLLQRKEGQPTPRWVSLIDVSGNGNEEKLVDCATWSLGTNGANLYPLNYAVRVSCQIG
ncbi:neurotrypsin-like isoform X2 [Acanthaster planci]|uniref:Neurotrypsin-like isoform X2 n=1 Tax=Acanthaster planci TaxID=133434 RepID=A0A8B7Y5N9_ACAPL|nr:neurotrypsin-like isoform X2 [Acanthaster planci]